MPTLVKQLFKDLNKEVLGQALWGQKIDCNQPGVYVVALSNSPDKHVCLNEAPVSEKYVQEWLDYVPKLILDGVRPPAKDLVNRVKSFWLPDETIVYIGKAGTSLRRRIGQYYNTKLGDRMPHAGGHWIKTLDNLKQLNIYWTTSDNEKAKDVEDRFIKKFIDNVSPSTKEKLFDSSSPFPFANLEYSAGNRKKHGIKYSVNR